MDENSNREGYTNIFYTNKKLYLCIIQILEGGDICSGLS